MFTLSALAEARLRVQRLARGALVLALTAAELGVPAPVLWAGLRSWRGLTHTFTRVLIQPPPWATAGRGQPILANAVTAILVQQFIWPTQRQ